MGSGLEFVSGAWEARECLERREARAARERSERREAREARERACLKEKCAAPQTKP